MKQKIVIRVCGMCCDKCRSKAMAVAAATGGVDSVAIDGKYRDELVVVGECVDSIKLVCELRKKVGGGDSIMLACALRKKVGVDILEVSEVKKDDKKPPPQQPPPVKKDDKKPPPPPPQPQPPPVTSVCHHCFHHPVGYLGYPYYSCYCYRYCHFH